MNTVDKKEVLEFTITGVIEGDDYFTIEQCFASANEYFETAYELKYTDRRYVEMKVAEWKKNNL